MPSPETQSSSIEFKMNDYKYYDYGDLIDHLAGSDHKRSSVLTCMLHAVCYYLFMV